MKELQGLQLRVKDFQSRGVQLVAISVDTPEQVARLARKKDLTFPILSDADLAATDAFGLRHKGGFKGRDIALPGTYVIHDGTVRWRDLTPVIDERPTPDAVLAAVDAHIPHRDATQP